MAMDHNMRKDSAHLKLYELLNADARFYRAASRTVAEDGARNNNFRHTHLRVLPMHINAANENAASRHPSRLERILRYLRKPSPYLSFGLLLLPGGSLLMLLLWLFQQAGRK
jgi:hypothetical protein